MASDALVEQIEALGRRMGTVRDQVGRSIFGQNEVVDQTLITLLAGGHALLLAWWCEGR
jgi:MoxR-like ATPase